MKEVEDIDGNIIQVSNSKYKKDQALEHNATMEFAENVFPCGSCHCKDDKEECSGITYMYLKSNDENIFKYYHTECTEVGDIRHPVDGQDSFNFPLMEIMRFLAEKYGADKIERLQNES